MNTPYALGLAVALLVPATGGSHARAAETAHAHTGVDRTDDAHAHDHANTHAHDHDQAVRRPEAAPAVPADALARPDAAAGVADLRFADFFKMPVGPRGLEYADALLRLDGKKVRIAGYMARQEDPRPGLLLLCPAPFQLHEHEYGLAEDLPPTTLHVVDPTRPHEIVPFTPGPLVLTGRLHLGGREEADGRVSIARLVLDPPAASAASAAPATVAVPAGRAEAPSRPITSTPTNTTPSTTVHERKGETR